TADAAGAGTRAAATGGATGRARRLHVAGDRTLALVATVGTAAFGGQCVLLLFRQFGGGGLLCRFCGLLPLCLQPSLDGFVVEPILLDRLQPFDLVERLLLLDLEIGLGSFPIVRRCLGLGTLLVQLLLYRGVLVECSRRLFVDDADKHGSLRPLRRSFIAGEQRNACRADTDVAVYRHSLDEFLQVGDLGLEIGDLLIEPVFLVGQEVELRLCVSPCVRRGVGALTGFGDLPSGVFGRSVVAAAVAVGTR